MGIKQAWNIKGVSFANCHHRIKQATVYDDNTLAVIVVRYADIGTKNADLKNGLEFQGYQGIAYNKAGNQNPFQVAYTYIMALPEYSESSVE